MRRKKKARKECSPTHNAPYCAMAQQNTLNLDELKK
jgi:hypothetical protein